MAVGFAWPATADAGCPPMDRRPSLCVLPTPPWTGASPLQTTTTSRSIPLPANAIAPDSPPADHEAPPPAALARRRLSACISDSDEMEQLAARGLVVDDRDQMDDFMSFATETADCGSCPLSRSASHSACLLAMPDLLLLPLLACRDGRRGRRPPHPAQPRQRWPATGRERPTAPPAVHPGASVLVSASDFQRSWCADSALLSSCPASLPVLDLAHAAFGAPRSPRPSRPSHGTLV
jgi:hypothetical protein